MQLVGVIALSRYPKSARAAIVKCLPCNAPGAESIEGEYVCVECGRTIIENASRT